MISMFLAAFSLMCAVGLGLFAMVVVISEALDKRKSSVSDQSVVLLGSAACCIGLALSLLLRMIGY